MFFLQAAQAPVEVCVGDRVFVVPKMTMDELVEWGVEIESERTDRVTSNMDDNRRAEHLTFYPPTAPGLQEMANHVRTVPGIRRVIGSCFKRCEGGYQRKTREKINPPTEQEISQWLGPANGPGRLASLAWELADMRDISKEDPNPENKEDDGKSPLTGRGKAA